jgi:hypothetical protein
MKKNVLVFGLIAGAIVTLMMIFSTIAIMKNSDFKPNMVLGYATMIVAFAFIFVGIKNFRDKHNGGVVSFGKAFRIGLFISLIASTMYVVTWLIEFYGFFPDFAAKFAECSLRDLKASGASPEKLAEHTTEMAKFAEMYKNPFFVVIFTYAEVLPIGIVVALISALILKRKKPATAMA